MQKCFRISKAPTEVTNREDVQKLLLSNDDSGTSYLKCVCITYPTSR